MVVRRRENATHRAGRARVAFSVPFDRRSPATRHPTRQRDRGWAGC